jgi:hypothetical protein
MIIDRKTYKLIERHLYHYHDIRREVAQAREEILAGGNTPAYGDSNAWIKARGKNSDITGIKAVELAGVDTRWLEVIEAVRARYKGTTQREVIAKTNY